MIYYVFINVFIVIIRSHLGSRLRQQPLGARVTTSRRPRQCSDLVPRVAVSPQAFAQESFSPSAQKPPRGRASLRGKTCAVMLASGVQAVSRGTTTSTEQIGRACVRLT